MRWQREKHLVSRLGNSCFSLSLSWETRATKFPWKQDSCFLHTHKEPTQPRLIKIRHRLYLKAPYLPRGVEPDDLLVTRVLAFDPVGVTRAHPAQAQIHGRSRSIARGFGRREMIYAREFDLMEKKRELSRHYRAPSTWRSRARPFPRSSFVPRDRVIETALVPGE